MTTDLLLSFLEQLRTLLLSSVTETPVAGIERRLLSLSDVAEVVLLVVKSFTFELKQITDEISVEMTAEY